MIGMRVQKWGGASLLAGALASCAVAAGVVAEPLPRHQPQVIMGRDCWRVLNKFTGYMRLTDKPLGMDNAELNAHPALSDVVPVYVARAEVPACTTGYAVWPQLADYFRPGSPDREILHANPQPDRPFFLVKNSERRRTTWGSPVALDAAAYATWRAAHPNLVADGNISEWCNDLNNAWTTLAGKNGMYVNNLPDSTNRYAALKKFMGEKPKTRYEQLDLLRRYFAMRQERNFGGKMAVLDAHLNSLHVAADLGAVLIRLETTASGQYRYQPSAMFTRGAARQFGIPWEWYIAGYVNGPSAKTGELLGDVMCRYPTAATVSDEVHYAKPVTLASGRTMRIGCGGPDFGISRSLFARTHYLAYLSGANYIQLEEWSRVLKMWDKESGKTVFSPRGEIYARFAEFMRRYPDRGAHYSPVAICVPLAQGYPTWGGVPWANPAFGYTAGDKAVDAIFYTLVPGMAFNEHLQKGDEMCLRNSPYADMYDVISPDATSLTPEQLLAVMKSYKALIIAGDYRDKAWEATLARYAAEGGDVLRVDAALLADEVKTGKKRGISAGETAYPQLEAKFRDLQERHFPFAVEGRCHYGLTVSKSHAWLYVFNHEGVTKFADAREQQDPSKASTIRIMRRSNAPYAGKVVELLSDREVRLADGREFTCTLGPGEFAIYSFTR